MVTLATAAALLAGWASALVGVRWAPRVLAGRRHVRENYRGRQVVATLGIVLAVPLAVAGAIAAAVARTGRGSVTQALAITGAGLSMGALGLADDVWGDRSAGGFAGHLRALRSGRLTTGLVKAAGGGVVGLIAAWMVVDGWRVLVAGAVIALGANLANLLDLRPGRALKAWLIAWVVFLLAPTGTPALVTTSGLAGGILGFLPSDLGERGMLGDAGANLVGAALATAAAASMSAVALLSTLGVLVALTLASEVVSFSRVIEGTPPLRALDRLGRDPD